MSAIFSNYTGVKSAAARAAILAAFFTLIFTPLSLALQGENVSSDGSATYPTQGLSQKERSGLEKEYQFMIRGKERLLVPVTGSEAVRSDKSPPSAVDGEGYRRYVGAAIDLYKAGRLEESMKVFRYLNEIDPGDDYVKSYLSRVKREMKSEDAKWKNGTVAEAASMKKDKVKSLLRDGIDFYNNKDFDSALVRFHDILAIDPENSTAKQYMDKLKAYYPKKLEAEAIVENWEKKGPPYLKEKPDEPHDNPPSPIQKSADAMLDKAGPSPESAAETMLNDAQVEKVASDKKAEELLEEVEFGLEADAIISAKRAEEVRDNQMMLGSGDMLRMSVMNHPEFSGDISVQSNGYVSIPLTGDEVAASGFTIDELSVKVAQVLGKYIEGPQVSVFMITSRSQIFYVVDEISCTPYPITRPDFTLRDALFLADWGDNRALGRVIVIKPSARNPVIRKVDAFNIIYRGNLKDNIRITSGDVIYIPMTIMAKTTKGIYDSIAPFRAIRTARDEYLNLKWNEKDYKSFFKMPKDYAGESESAKDVNSDYYSLPTFFYNR